MKKYVRILVVMAVCVFAACDSGGGDGDGNDWGDDGVPKSLKITDIPGNPTVAGFGLLKYFPNGNNFTMEAGCLAKPVSNNTFERDILAAVDNEVTADSENWTGTGSYYIFFNNLTADRLYATQKKITIKDALTIVSYTDWKWEEFILGE